MKLYQISDAIRQALDHIELDEETGEILSADALHAVEAEAAEKIGELAAGCTNPRDSWRASKEFRLQLIKEMSKRSLIYAARRGGADI